MTILEIKIEGKDFHDFLSNCDVLMSKALYSGAIDRGSPEYNTIKAFMDDFKRISPDETTDHYILKRVMK